ncbi:MAG TPA: hypothetical protein VGK73_00900 [Polyangiaceae bacterium]
MRSTTGTRAWLCLALLFCGAACSRKQGPPGRGEGRGSARPIESVRAGAGAEPEAVRLCAALHELPTRRRAECCAAPAVTLFHDECVRHLSAALRARTVAVDGAGVTRCAEAASRALGGCDWVAPALAASPPECRGLVTGRLAEGAACRSSLECAENLHCEGQGATSPGTCRAPRGLGAGCGVGADPLATYVAERGLEERKPACEGMCSLVTHRCEPTPAPLSACRASVNCAPEQVCTGGRCEPRAPGSEGTACGFTACARGFRCVSGRCTARALPGEACTTDLDCALGGCVSAADGAGRCGTKCTPSFGALAKSGRSGLRLLDR